MTMTPAIPSDRPDAGALVRQFLSGRSPATVTAYRADLDAFGRWVDPFGNATDSLGAMIAGGGRPGQAHALIHRWRADMIEEGLAPSTINRRLSAIRSILRLARQFGLISWRLEIDGVKTRPYRDTRGPGGAAVALLLVEAGKSADEAKRWRDVAIIRLLYDLALRRQEVVTLDLADVDFAGSRLMVMGKGRREKAPVTMTPAVEHALAEWIRARGKRPGPLITTLAHARRGDRLTGRGLYEIVRGLGDKAGVRARPHGLRHSAITAALDATNGDARRVRAFSRHAKADTVLAYDDNRADHAGDIARAVSATISEDPANGDA